MLDHIHRRAGSYAIADIPLQDPAQHMMLVNIDRISMHGTLPSQRELAASMHLSPATVTATLKLLERSGYVRRVADDRDQRINRVALTESGKTTRRTAEGEYVFSYGENYVFKDAPLLKRVAYAALRVILPPFRHLL